ncbi:MAG: RMD1 family protein [Gammaproteobacteria bacterium]
MMNDKALKQCEVFCLARQFDISGLARSLSDRSLIRLIKGALMVESNESCSVILAYGAVVHWNIGRQEQSALHELLLGHAENPAAVIEEENFTYALDCPSTRIIEDHIEIDSSDPMVLFSLSLGMAQSIKLASFESNAIATINNTSYIPKSLAETGKIRLSRREIAIIRGQLFLTKNDIILNYDLLDTPDFFWEYPEYEDYYTLVAKYLEILPRTEVLSKKLETIHELFEMLADEQKHRHSSRLEWIIIYLIALEIVMMVVEKLL